MTAFVKYKVVSSKKKLKIIFGVIILILIVGLILIFVAIPNQSIFDDGNLGNWELASFNPTTETGTINVNVNFGRIDVGWLGGKTMQQGGTDKINNQQDCEAFGWVWKIDDQANPYNCVVRNQNWIEDKEITSNVQCVHSKPPYICDDFSCIPQDNPPIDVTPSFNGERISLSANKRGSDDSVSCSGTITISQKSEPPPGKITIYRLENNECNSYQISKQDRLSSDYDTLENCKKDIKTPYIKYILIGISLTAIFIFIGFLIYLAVRKR